MRSFLICLLIILLKASAFSQINTEFFRKPTPQIGFDNSLYLTLNYQSGNTNSIELISGASSNYYNGFLYFRLNMYLDYEEGLDRSILTNKGFIYLAGELPYSSIFTQEIFLQKNFNKKILLRDRNLVGTNVRAKLYNFKSKEDSTTAFYVFLGTGFMYDMEKYYLEYPDVNSFWSNSFLTVRWEFNKYFTLSATATYQKELNSRANFRFLAENAISFMITKNLSFSFSTNYRYNNIIAKEIKNFDLQIINSIQLSF